MQIVHIASLDNSLGGVNIAVPQQVMAQQLEIDAALLNITNIKIDKINHQIEYRKKFTGFDKSYQRPDLIVFHEVYRPIYLKIYPYLLKEKIPYIICPHGGLTVQAQHIKFLKKAVANKLMFQKFFRNAEAIQCLSEQEMKNTTFGRRRFIGTNGISIEMFENIFSDIGVNIIYIGRLDIYIKGLDLLLDAIMLEKEYLVQKNVKISLYGPNTCNSHQKLRDLIKKNDIGAIVSVYDVVVKEEKLDILKKADCFIQTSRSEGMSMGILEALGNGLPCILTEGTGMKEEVIKQNAGWGCENSAESIAKALREAVKEKSLFSEKSRNARRFIKENYLWEKVTKRTLNEYEKILRIKQEREQC